MAERPKRRYQRAAVTREHILDVASHLFYSEGIRAVGVDRLADEAEVTTTTLYRLFGSKDGLVAAYMDRRDTEWFEWLERSVSKGGLAGLFKELDRNVRESDFRGCPFRMAMAEYPAAESDVQRIGIENKRRTRRRFRQLAREAGAPDPATAADQLLLLIDGILASGAERTPESPPGAGPKLARELMNGWGGD
jgi:AcrR family transcriptional regulator